MSDAQSFRGHDYAVPAGMLAWQLRGRGFDSLGDGGRPELIDIPAPGPGEVLMRVDAVGLCFSDVKLIKAGNTHPRIRGRDLVAEPTRPGHEVSLTLAAMGEGVDLDWKVGDRFIIQANIFAGGESVAFGYVISGGLSQYCIFDGQVLSGDDGNYLIPVPDEVGLVEAALVEPWACVEGAYRLPTRTEMVEGGARVIVDLTGSAPDLSGGAGQFEVITEGDSAALEAAIAKIGSQPDDIIVIGDPSGDFCGAILDSLADGGTLCLLGCSKTGGLTSVDVGRVHYRDIRIVGSAGLDVDAAYGSNTRADILPKGTALFPGAAGPMGMMHIQRAIEAEGPPRLVVVTDISAERLDYAEKLLAPLAAECGVEYASLNPMDFKSPEAADAKIAEMSGGAGYDDIVVCAPVGAVIAASANHAAQGCVVNIFAGVPLGTMSELDLGDVALKAVKYTGASGSSIDDMLLVLDKVAAGSLNTRMSLGAVGGMNQGLEGLKGVAEGRFYGKVVLFPWVEDLPLETPLELASRMPAVAGGLDAGGIWTGAAEDLFVEELSGEAPGMSAGE